MRRSLLLAAAAAGLLAGGAAATPPPNAPPPPSGAPVGKPVPLAVPAPGKAVITKVVVTAKLKKPTATLTPIGWGTPPQNLRVASAETKPVVAGGALKITYYFIVGDVSRRSLSSASVDVAPQIGFVADPTAIEYITWSAGMLKKLDGCGPIRDKLRGLTRRVIYGNPGDTAALMWIEGLKRLGC